MYRDFASQHADVVPAAGAGNLFRRLRDRFGHSSVLVASRCLRVAGQAEG